MMYTTKTCDVGIIGGGAAGMLAAIILAENGKNVVIIEHNSRLGKKLSITGKGRCNLTNNCAPDEVLKNIPQNSKFMYSSVNMFSPRDTMEFFGKLGVALKTERGNRVFPENDKSETIVSALTSRLQALEVPILQDEAVKIVALDGCVTSIKCKKYTVNVKYIVLATGGKSYPSTGSNGSGYALASSLSHTITELQPSLIPLETLEDCSAMMGLSLKNVVLTLYDGDKKIFSELGEMLFTHFGLSGPLVLSASSYIPKMEENRYKISIDLKPAMDEKKLDLRLQRDILENQNKQLQNGLESLLPSKLIMPFIERTGLNSTKRMCEIARAERLLIVKTLKNLDFNITHFRPIEEAIITSGGVDTKEINPKTMESKKVNGLYFAGEIIDVNAFTGGFNLQIAFSTAAAVARAITSKG